MNMEGAIKLRLQPREVTKQPSEEYQRFENIAREIIAVPKRILDKREAAYQRKKLAEKKRKVV